MLISYNFNHVFYPGADKVMNQQTLREMIEFLVRVNLIYLTRAREFAIAVPSLYRSGVYYKRAGYWEPIPQLYQRGWGDCKSLASALIAEQRFAGIYSQPATRWVENADGTTDYHILVQLGNKFEDPSKRLGMGADEVAKFYAVD
jgi:hypothetical protein